MRVGYLGYTSVGHPEGTAGPGKPGVMNLRVKTSYDTRGPHQPVRIRTEPHADDLAMLLEDVQALRKNADVAILAFHSGVIRLPRVVSDYQVAVAHAAIDAGADLVVCHAPHIPKAIEVYQRQSDLLQPRCFLDDEALRRAFMDDEPAWAHGAVRNHTDLDPAYPFMPYGEASTLSLLAKVQVSDRRVSKVSFLPMTFDSKVSARGAPPAGPEIREGTGLYGMGCRRTCLTHSPSKATKWSCPNRFEAQVPQRPN